MRSFFIQKDEGLEAANPYKNVKIPEIIRVDDTLIRKYHLSLILL